MIDITGQPLYSWDAAGMEFRFTYDNLRRPLQQWGDGKMLSRIVYGENVFDDKWLNLRGQVIATYDGAGKHYVEEYDFKGIPRRSYMRLLINAQTADADWNVLTGAALTSDETFFTEVVSDALGRPRSMDSGRILGTGTPTTEHNITTHTYGKDGALKTVNVTGSGNYVQDIHHNAKGQREAIWYGNGTKTKYRYDHLTQRLKRLCTVRLSDGNKLQDLCYHYDPVGNITRITDAAQEDVWFANTIVSPKNEYTYDAIYRLIKAEGREKKATASFGAADNSDDSRAMVGAPARWDGGGNALQRYTQYYSYDAVGNILQLQHSAAVGSYTRSYTYVAGSNRLLSTTVGSTTYPCTHDMRGNMTGLPHLGAMDYDLLNQMRHVTAGTSVNAYYQYSGGERTRKWVDKSGGIVEERIYFGSYEVYRKWSSSSVSVERTTLHVGDDAGRVAMIEKRTIGTALADNDTAAELKRFIYSNHLQSAALELDETGEILSYEEYHPYGTTAYQATNTAIKAVAKRYRFTGKERDEESGLNYHSARYYIPWLCRWAAVDPLQGQFAVWSSYQYGNSNPVNYVDPSGKASLPPARSEGAWMAPLKPATGGSALEFQNGLPTIVNRAELPGASVSGTYNPKPITGGNSDRYSPVDNNVHMQPIVEPLLHIPNPWGGPPTVTTPTQLYKQAEAQARSQRYLNQGYRGTPAEEIAHETVRVAKLREAGYNADGSPGLTMRLMQDPGFRNLSERFFQAAEVIGAAEGVYAIGKSLATIGGKEGINIALGKNINLMKFAEQKNVASFHTWDISIPGHAAAKESFYNFEGSFQYATNAVEQSGGKILFNMEYVNINAAKQIKPGTGLYERSADFGGKSLWELNRTTEWELSQILNSPTLLNRTQFYRMGIEIPLNTIK